MRQAQRWPRYGFRELEPVNTRLLRLAALLLAGFLEMTMRPRLSQRAFPIQLLLQASQSFFNRLTLF